MHRPKFNSESLGKAARNPSRAPRCARATSRRLTPLCLPHRRPPSHNYARVFEWLGRAVHETAYAKSNAYLPTVCENRSRRPFILSRCHNGSKHPQVNRILAMILNFDLMDLTRWLTENAPRLLISAIIVDSVCRGVLLHPPYHVGAKRSDRMERLFRLRRKATEKQVLQTLLILTT